MDNSVFIGIILAIVLGGLIGTERELPWSGTRKGGADGFGGIRTYASIAFFGALCTWLDVHFGTNIWIFAGAILSACFILASYVYGSFRQDKMGATSEYAALLTYFIGVIAMIGEYTFAVIISIALLLLLSSKEYFAKLKNKLSRQEFGDSLKFAVIALVILPLLPAEKYSLLDMANWAFSGGIEWTHKILIADFFNPFSVWRFVVIMAGVEYAGYLMSKFIGNKGGILASGSIGGLISSTAVTVAMTKKSKEHPENVNAYVVSTLLASCIMFIRVVLLGAYIYPPIVSSILLPGGVMFLGLTGMVLYYYLKSRDEKTDAVTGENQEYESPFQILPAIQFAGLIVMINFFAALGKIYRDVVPQEISSYFLGVVSGLADVDAINQAMSEMARDNPEMIFIATTTILIAVISNNTVKASIAYRFGESNFGKKVMLGFGVSIGLGLFTIVILSLARYLGWIV